MPDSEIDAVLRQLNVGLRQPETSTETFDINLAKLIGASRDSEQRRQFCVPRILQVCCSILGHGTTKAEPFPGYVEKAVIFLNNSCPDDDSVNDLEANKRTIVRCGGLVTLLKLLNCQLSSLWGKVLSALNNICFEHEPAQRTLADPRNSCFQTLTKLAIAQRQSLEVEHSQQDDICNLIDIAREYWVSSIEFSENDYVMLCRAAWQVNWQAENFCVIAKACLKLSSGWQIPSAGSDSFDGLLAVSQASFRYFTDKLDPERHYRGHSGPNDMEELTRHDCRNTQNDLLEKLYEVSQRKSEMSKSLLSSCVKAIQEGDNRPARICASYVLCGLILQDETELLNELSTSSFVRMITRALSGEDSIQGIRAQLQLIGLLAVSRAPNTRLYFKNEETVTAFARFFQGRGSDFLNPQIDAAIAGRKLMVESPSLVSQFFGLKQRDYNPKGNTPHGSVGYDMLELYEVTENTDLKAEIARSVAQICRTIRGLSQCAIVLDTIFASVEDGHLLIQPLVFTVIHHPSEGARIEGWMAIGVLTEAAGGRSALVQAINQDMAFRSKIQQISQSESGYEKENLKVVLAHMQEAVFEVGTWLDNMARNLGLEFEWEKNEGG